MFDQESVMSEIGIDDVHGRISDIFIQYEVFRYRIYNIGGYGDNGAFGFYFRQGVFYGASAASDIVGIDKLSQPVIGINVESPAQLLPLVTLVAGGAEIFGRIPSFWR